MIDFDWGIDPDLTLGAPPNTVAMIAVLPEEFAVGGYHIVASRLPDLDPGIVDGLTERARQYLTALSTDGPGPPWKWFTNPNGPSGWAFYIGYTPSDPDYDILRESLVVSAEPDLVPFAKPGQLGLIVVHPPAAGDRAGDFVAVHLPGLTDQQIAEFREFAVDRIYSFVKNGPLPELWQKRSIDDGWQIWMAHRTNIDDEVPDTVPNDWTD